MVAYKNIICEPNAKDAFSKRKDLLSTGMRKEVKKTIVKKVTWSVALHSAETYSLRKDKSIGNVDMEKDGTQKLDGKDNE